MNVVKYKTLLSQQRLPVLVRENAVRYDCSGDLRTPAEIVKMLNSVFRHSEETEEVVYLLAFSAKNLIGVFELSRGTVSFSVMNPREILQKLLLCGAVAAVVAHNHPSGCPEPSRDDIDSTRRVHDACNLMGIKLLDSIVIGDGEYISFFEKDLM